MQYVLYDPDGSSTGSFFYQLLLMETNKMVQLHSYINLAEAYADAEYLRSEDIECVVLDGFSGTLLPVLTGGIRLMVHEADLSRAKKLLESQAD